MKFIFLLSAVIPAWAQGPQLALPTNWFESQTPEQRVLGGYLLIHELVARKLIGTDTGVCAQFTPIPDQDEWYRMSIGLSTDAFPLGEFDSKQSLTPEKKAHLQQLWQALGNYFKHAGNLYRRVTVHGYADPVRNRVCESYTGILGLAPERAQALCTLKDSADRSKGYLADPTVEESIAANRVLARLRAKAVLDLVQNYPIFMNSSNTVQGHASPLGERLAFEQKLKKEQIECPLRRKVVIDIDFSPHPLSLAIKKGEVAPGLRSSDGLFLSTAKASASLEIIDLSEKLKTREPEVIFRAFHFSEECKNLSSRYFVEWVLDRYFSLNKVDKNRIQTWIRRPRAELLSEYQQHPVGHLLNRWGWYQKIGLTSGFLPSNPLGDLAKDKEEQGTFPMDCFPIPGVLRAVTQADRNSYRYLVPMEEVSIDHKARVTFSNLDHRNPQSCHFGCGFCQTGLHFDSDGRSSYLDRTFSGAGPLFEDSKTGRSRVWELHLDKTPEEMAQIAVLGHIYGKLTGAFGETHLEQMRSAYVELQKVRSEKEMIQKKIFSRSDFSLGRFSWEELRQATQQMDFDAFMKWAEANWIPVPQRVRDAATGYHATLRDGVDFAAITGTRHYHEVFRPIARARAQMVRDGDPTQQARTMRFGSLKAAQFYVLNDCAQCTCDIEQRLLDPHKSRRYVVDRLPFEVEIVDTQGKCLYTPPIPSSCLYAPVENETNPVLRAGTKVLSWIGIDGVKEVKSDNELLQFLKKQSEGTTVGRCEKQSGWERVRCWIESGQCSGAMSLPTDDELRDCRPSSAEVRKPSSIKKNVSQKKPPHKKN